MSKYVIDGTTLGNIADAIRAGSGSTEAMTPAEMAAVIAGMGGTGGTGGLPNGISALTTGTFTLATNQAFVHIDHNLGVVPNFGLCIVEGNSGPKPFTSGIICYSVVKKDMVDGTATARDCLLTLCSADSNGNYKGGGYVTNLGGTLFTTTKFPFMSITSDQFKAGSTYKWVCGVFDDIG